MADPDRRASPSPRALTLSTLDDVLAELDRLEASGYRRVGRWTLGQMADHLRFYSDRAVDGFGFRLPWLVQVLVGRPAFRRILRTRSFGRNGRTLPKSVPGPAEQTPDGPAVDRLRASLIRLRDHAGPFQPSPIFGRLTPDEVRELNIVHCQHHLAYLIPGGDA